MNMGSGVSCNHIDVIPLDSSDIDQNNTQPYYDTELYARLLPFTLSNSPSLFSWQGVSTLAKVIKVYDGDTCHVVFEAPYTKIITHIVVRLRGYDSPELRSKSEREKEAAKAARDALIAFIGKDGIVFMTCYQPDKYGRTLADFFTYPLHEHINKWMVDRGYGVEYDGGPKRSFLDNK
eukprot:TRINITY_DN1269_c0_g1_i4.p2 TRINITY_DN1269_c0_g1~~TRINITY_DN1269_c0_g1_i4.p2  ORF type:complete len:178 (+),score=12.64 TRINITY_DN1269_c0_g1_i4:1409-1942(+)